MGAGFLITDISDPIGQLLDGFFQQLTGCEFRLFGGLDLDLLSGPRIDTFSGLSVGNLEDTESGNVDLVSRSQNFGDLMEKSIQPFDALLFGCSHLFRYSGG